MTLAEFLTTRHGIHSRQLASGAIEIWVQWEGLPPDLWHLSDYVVSTRKGESVILVPKIGT